MENPIADLVDAINALNCEWIASHEYPGFCEVSPRDAKSPGARLGARVWAWGIESGGAEPSVLLGNDTTPRADRHATHPLGDVTTNAANIVQTMREQANLWALEFGPEYRVPAEIIAALGAGKIDDCSWHNDVMPSFTLPGDDGQDLRLWVDAEKVDDREHGGGCRFNITFESGVLMEGDEIGPVLERFLSFADVDEARAYYKEHGEPVRCRSCGQPSEDNSGLCRKCERN